MSLNYSIEKNRKKKQVRCSKTQKENKIIKSFIMKIPFLYVYIKNIIMYGII